MHTDLARLSRLWWLWGLVIKENLIFGTPRTPPVTTGTLATPQPLGYPPMVPPGLLPKWMARSSAQRRLTALPRLHASSGTPISALQRSNAGRTSGYLPVYPPWYPLGYPRAIPPGDPLG